MRAPFWRKKNARLRTRLNSVVESAERAKHSLQLGPPRVEIDSSFVEGDPGEGYFEYETEATERDPAEQNGEHNGEFVNGRIDGFPAGPFDDLRVPVEAQGDGTEPGDTGWPEPDASALSDPSDLTREETARRIAEGQRNRMAQRAADAERTIHGRAEDAFVPGWPPPLPPLPASDPAQMFAGFPPPPPIAYAPPIALPPPPPPAEAFHAVVASPGTDPIEAERRELEARLEAEVRGREAAARQAEEADRQIARLLSAAEERERAAEAEAKERDRFVAERRRAEAEREAAERRAAEAERELEALHKSAEERARMAREEAAERHRMSAERTRAEAEREAAAARVAEIERELQRLRIAAEERTRIAREQAAALERLRAEVAAAASEREAVARRAEEAGRDLALARAAVAETELGIEEARRDRSVAAAGLAEAEAALAAVVERAAGLKREMTDLRAQMVEYDRQAQAEAEARDAEAAARIAAEEACRDAEARAVELEALLAREAEAAAEAERIAREEAEAMARESAELARAAAEREAARQRTAEIERELEAARAIATEHERIARAETEARERAAAELARIQAERFEAERRAAEVERKLVALRAAAEEQEKIAREEAEARRREAAERVAAEAAREAAVRRAAELERLLAIEQERRSAPADRLMAPEPAAPADGASVFTPQLMVASDATVVTGPAADVGEPTSYAEMSSPDTAADPASGPVADASSSEGAAPPPPPVTTDPPRSASSDDEAARTASDREAMIRAEAERAAVEAAREEVMRQVAEMERRMALERERHAAALARAEYEREEAVRREAEGERRRKMQGDPAAHDESPIRVVRKLSSPVPVEPQSPGSEVEALRSAVGEKVPPVAHRKPKPVIDPDLVETVDADALSAPDQDAPHPEADEVEAESMADPPHETLEFFDAVEAERKGSETRRDRRVDSRLPATLSREGRQPLACTIRDRSGSGARLELRPDRYSDGMSHFSVGDTLTLTTATAQERTHVPCVVIWIEGNACGVRYTGQFRTEQASPRPSIRRGPPPGDRPTGKSGKGWLRG